MAKRSKKTKAKKKAPSRAKPAGYKPRTTKPRRRPAKKSVVSTNEPTKKKRRPRGKVDSTGRGSPEAVQKRRTARELNTALGANKSVTMDGRTAKRRSRLLRELKDGRNGKVLKPIDLLSHTNELLEIGESWASLKKQGVRPRKIEINEDLIETSVATQKAYDFRPDSWLMLGIDIVDWMKQ